MIEVNALSKQFGSFTAVNDISFTMQPGEVFGLLGPNGAGKSTTISCISGLIPPSAGQIAISGHDLIRAPRAAKARLGIVPQEMAIYEDISVVQNLRYWGAAYGLRGTKLTERVADVLEVIGLVDRGWDKPKDFSGGMKRRLNFGCGIVHEPDVLLLDEPTVGVDPQSRERLFGMVREQIARGASVLYTTHHMEEAESLCDRIAIVDKGHKIAEGTLAELRAQVGERDVITLTGDFAPELADGGALPDGVAVLQAEDTRLTLEAEDGPARLATLLDVLTKAGADVHETIVRRPNLESLFLKLTGAELRA